MYSIKRKIREEKMDTQDILRLQVPIWDIQVVQVLERKEHVGGVEARALFVKLLLALQVVKQLPTVDVPQDEVTL
jgi:hypothetical protein